MWVLGACSKVVAEDVIRQVARRLMGAILSTADSSMFSGCTAAACG